MGAQVSLVLKKTGNPTGTATVVIRKGTDDSIEGDKLLLEYLGGDTSNFVSLKRTDADAFDGTKTCGISLTYQHWLTWLSNINNPDNRGI